MERPQAKLGKDAGPLPRPEQVFNAVWKAHPPYPGSRQRADGRSQPSRFDYDVCVILLRQEGIKNFEQVQFNVLVGTQEAPMRR